MAAKKPPQAESNCGGTRNGHPQEGSPSAAVQNQTPGAPQSVFPEDIEHLVAKRTAELSEENERLRQELAKASSISEERILAEERFRQLFEHMSSGVVVYEALEKGETFIFKDLNQAAERIENISKRDLIGKSVAQVFPGVVEFGLLEVFQRVWQTGKPQHHPISFYKDERIAGWRENYVYKLPSGEIVAIYDDITERKRAEAEREELITKLEAQNTELERFTYTVSHDLRSPLITINGYVGMLRQDLAEGDAERGEEDLSRISNAAIKMDQLLTDVLELSRIGRFVNAPEDVPLGELAQEAIAAVDGRLQQAGIEVEVSDDLPVVFGDRLRLLEVLQNLIENAVKYMGNQPRPRVEVGARRDGNETVYYVRDNGIGIDPSYQERVFGLFDQLDPKVEGCGIGLSLVKRIVEVHGGRIWIESEGVGHGSTFCFTIEAMGKS